MPDRPAPLLKALEPLDPSESQDVPASRTAYVLDTSVLVHDPKALRAFRGTTVAVPIFVVMELDDLKNSRRHEVASSARIASRFISGLRDHGNLSADGGVFHPEIGSHFQIISDGNGGLGHVTKSTNLRSMDMLILQSALAMAATGRFDRVVLISKDVNLRILAEFEGLVAEDYEADRVPVEELFTGYRRVETEDLHALRRAYVPGEELSPADLDVDPADLCPNEFLIVASGDREAVMRFEAEAGALVPVAREFPELDVVEPRNVEQRMALALLLDPGVQLVSLVGKAGTGKTFLALAAALAQLRRGRDGGAYERVILSKPVVAMGQDIGYLPGDFDAKMQPWMMPFFDNLDQMMGDGDGGLSKGASRATPGWEYLFESGRLDVQALHTIRGRSIARSFMLIDEAQNLTPHEAKTVITRAAEGTKVVLAGDPFQVDNRFLDQHSNGLVHVAERLKHSPLSGTVYFRQGERSALAELAATRL